MQILMDGLTIVNSSPLSLRQKSAWMFLKTLIIVIIVILTTWQAYIVSELSINC